MKGLKEIKSSKKKTTRGNAPNSVYFPLSHNHLKRDMFHFQLMKENTRGIKFKPCIQKDLTPQGGLLLK